MDSRATDLCPIIRINQLKQYLARNYKEDKKRNHKDIIPRGAKPTLTSM